ncbi:hypothetical protein [Marinobacter fonticola]|uniref:hypothetical protein n=1 Tax=Marinobacter fonticola TaxID=2603215 RepID=UPI001930FDD6|nr:hypothetical protein [Marinobacter fonticola]
MATTEAKARPSPVLQPGRPADPAPPAPVGPEINDPEIEGELTEHASLPSEVTEDAAVLARVEDASEATASEALDEPQPNRETLMMQQSGYRRLLRQCERVLLLDFNTLAMPDWPDNFSMASARRRRDLWLFSASLAAILFLAGVPGLVPAWMAGTAFGAFVLIVLAGIPFIRKLYSAQSSHLDLLVRRQRRVREARSHIQHLEGSEGLAWQCAMMAEFNPALKSTRFSALVNLSEKRILARELRRRDHIRLYLIFMLEAEKAYERLQRVYFEGHQTAIDNGWGPQDDDQQPQEEEGSSDTELAQSKQQVDSSS